MRQTNHTGRQHCCSGFFTKSTYERAVDLDVVNREALEIRQRRVTGAEVVQDRPHAKVLKHLKSGCRRRSVAHGGTFGDLQAEVVRIEADHIEYTADDVGQTRLPEL